MALSEIGVKTIQSYFIWFRNRSKMADVEELSGEGSGEDQDEGDEGDYE